MTHGHGFSRTAAALAALVGGFALGIALSGSSSPAAAAFVDAVGAVGQLWVAAIRLTIIPLVVALTLSAIVGVSASGSVGGLGGRALLLFVAMLVGAGLFAFAVTAPVLALYPVDGDTSMSLRAGTSPRARGRPADLRPPRRSGSA